MAKLIRPANTCVTTRTDFLRELTRDATDTIAWEVFSFMQLAFELAVIVVLLALNAFLAASEISIVSSRKPRLRAMIADGNRSAKRVLALAESPSGFLATVQV